MECPRVVMVKAMGGGIRVSEFELQSRCFQFRTNTLGKGVNPFILSTMGQIVSLLFFKKDGFGIKFIQDMPLKQRNQTKPS